jgi:hypothetical protein
VARSHAPRQHPRPAPYGEPPDPPGAPLRYVSALYFASTLLCFKVGAGVIVSSLAVLKTLLCFKATTKFSVISSGAHRGSIAALKTLPCSKAGWDDGWRLRPNAGGASPGR